MKLVYCSKCNTQLPVTRKVYPKHTKIFDTISPHICPEEPVPLDFGPPSDIPTQPAAVEQSVQNLDELRPSQIDADLRDRRTDVLNTSAPLTLLDNIRKLKGNG